MNKQRETIVAKIGPTGYGSWGIRWVGSRFMDERGGYSGPWKDEAEAREGVERWRGELSHYGDVTIEVVENVNNLD